MERSKKRIKLIERNEQIRSKEENNSEIIEKEKRIERRKSRSRKYPLWFRIN